MNTVRTVRIAAIAFAAGALWHIVSCLRYLANPTEPGSAAFALSNNVGSIAHLLWLAGLLALAVVTWGTSGGAARAGYAITATGLAMLTTAELIIGASFKLSQALFTVSMPVTAVGLTCLGIATARRLAPDRAGLVGLVGPVGLARWALAATGLYVLVVMAPAFAIFGAPNYPALIGWGVTWLISAAATWQVAHRLGTAG